MNASLRMAFFVLTVALASSSCSSSPKPSQTSAPNASSSSSGSRPLQSPPTQQSFRDFIWPVVMSLELKIPKPVATDAQEIRKLNPAETRSRLISFYLSQLPKGTYEWKVEKLPGLYAMPTTHPVEALFNSNLLSAHPKGASPESDVFFRPVDISTGCNSGCTPVVFHLVYNSKGLLQKISEEPQRPLRKIWHQIFDDEDRKKLFTLARDLPESLGHLDEPSQAADSTSKFPPQTWTALKPMLVDGAAFSSYRVYEAAFKTREYFALRDLNANAVSDRLRSLRDSQDSLLASTFSVRNAEDGNKKISEILSILDAKSPAPAHIRRTALTLAPYLLLWLNEIVDASSAIESVFSLPAYTQVRTSAYCDFLMHLLKTPRGRERLVALLESPSRAKLPQCDRDETRSLPMLAASRNNDASQASQWLRDNLLVEAPVFVKSQAALLESFAHAAELAKQDTLFRRWASELFVRFPRYKSQIPSVQKLQSELDLNRDPIALSVEKSLREEMRREFLNPAIPFSTIQVTDLKKKPVDFKHILKEKRVVVFFASWCPHCQETLKHWNSLKLGADIWNRIQLVEVFQSAGATVSDFCQITELDSKICQSILKLDTDSSSPNRKFAASVGLLGVPRIMILNSKSEIVVSDFKASTNEGTDFGRDLKWLVEEVSLNPESHL